MKSLIEVVKEKIGNSISDAKLEVIDNTQLHKHHKSFNKSKAHLKIIIESRILKSLNSIESHKKITNILKDEIKNDIHSIEIKIK